MALKPSTIITLASPGLFSQTHFVAAHLGTSLYEKIGVARLAPLTCMRFHAFLRVLCKNKSFGGSEAGDLRKTI